ncbi:hypothetical protein M2277_000291 [Paenibacillus sp. LBL]|nr:hypothetical protein [Paenibacillus sp. LBL]
MSAAPDHYNKRYGDDRSVYRHTYKILVNAWLLSRHLCCREANETARHVLLNPFIYVRVTIMNL